MMPGAAIALAFLARVSGAVSGGWGRRHGPRPAGEVIEPRATMMKTLVASPSLPGLLEAPFGLHSFAADTHGDGKPAASEEGQGQESEEEEEGEEQVEAEAEEDEISFFDDFG